MAKKRKIHDPQKTIVEYIISASGYKIKKNIKCKHTKSMDKLSDQGRQAGREICEKITQIQIQYDNEDDRTKAFEQMMQERKPIDDERNAKYTAMYLIANNIARRGKPLHADVAFKKLKTLQHRGSIKALTAQWDLESTGKNHITGYSLVKRDVRYFLWNMFNVVLMDHAMYDYCLKEIQNRTHLFSEKYSSRFERKQLQRYQNFIKKFHKSVIEYQNTLSHEPF